jgi:hypothetical protein
LEGIFLRHALQQSKTRIPSHSCASLGFKYYHWNQLCKSLLFFSGSCACSKLVLWEAFFSP